MFEFNSCDINLVLTRISVTWKTTRRWEDREALYNARKNKQLSQVVLYCQYSYNNADLSSKLNGLNADVKRTMILQQKWKKTFNAQQQMHKSCQRMLRRLLFEKNIFIQHYLFAYFFTAYLSLLLSTWFFNHVIKVESQQYTKLKWFLNSYESAFCIIIVIIKNIVLL